MTTNLVQPAVTQLSQAEKARQTADRAKLQQFREAFGDDGERYFNAGITHHQAGMLHGLSGDRLAQRIRELSLPESLIPAPKSAPTEEDYARSLGSAALGKAAAAIERANPLVCGRK